MALETFHGSIIIPNTGTLPVARTVTGFAFQPKLVIFYSASLAAFNTTTTHVRDCVGAARSPTEQFTIGMASDGAGAAAGNTGRIARYGTECICIPLNGTPAIDALASFVQFNADGFQINFTDLAASANMEVNYLAVGGSDITNVAIRNVTPVSTTNGATQAIDFGFPPDCCLFFSPAVPSTTGIVDANTCFGVATRVTGQQYTSFWFENDAAANMDCCVYSTNQRCHSQPGTTAVKDADASIQSWDATGVTLLWNDAVAATTARVYAIGIQGGEYELEQILAPTTAGTVNYPTSITPKGLWTFGTTDPTDTDTTASAATVDSCVFIGAADGALNQGNVSYIQRDANATSVCQRRQSKTKLTSWMTGTTGTLAADANVSAIGSTSFDLNWTTATAGTRRFVALVLGEAAPLGGPLTPATETDTAQPLTKSKAPTVTPAAETDTAVALVKTKTRSVTPAAETDQAQTLVVSKPIVVSLTPATETNTAQALTVTRPETHVDLTPAAEADVAQALAFTKPIVKALISAAELDAAAQLRTPYRLTPALEQDLALALLVSGGSQPPDTHPDLGGLITQPTRGGVFDETSTGGLVTTYSRGGNVTQVAKGGVITQPSRNGVFDESLTGGEVY